MPTLICLISGQLAPNLLSVIKLEPKSVVLIHTKDTMKQAEYFGAMIQKRYGVQEVVKREFHPFNPMTIRKAAEDLIQDMQERNITLNYTGGTKPMAIELVRAFEAHNTTFIYTDTQQELFWLTKNGKISEIPFDFRFNLQTLIDLKDVTIKSQADSSVIHELEPLTEFLFQEKRAGRASPVTELFDGAVDIRLNEKIISQWKPYLQTSRLEVKTITRDKISMTWMDKPFPQKKKLFWLDYFSGGWFEQWCYLVLEKQGFFDDVRCNINIKPERKSHPDFLKNEIDVAAVANGIPLFVECKSGKVDQKSITNLKAIRDYYGPSYSQAILVSFYPVKNNVLKEKITNYGLRLAEGSEDLKERLIEISEQMIVKI